MLYLYFKSGNINSSRGGSGIKVFVDRLGEDCESLENLLIQEKKILYELDEIINSLLSISGMEDIIEFLQIVKEEVEKESIDTWRMLNALIKIRQCYTCVEEKNIDNAEEILYTAKRVEIAVLEYSQQFKNLEKVNIIL